MSCPSLRSSGRGWRGALVAATALWVGVASSCGGVGPASVGPGTAAAPSADEHARAISALRPPKRARPVVAVLADNAGTETTDFLVPYGVLRESHRADVFAVAPDAGPIELMPALRVRPQLTTAAFDELYPDGADYVVVPAMHRRDAPRVLEWLRAQAESGATLVGICSGAMVIAEAGLFEDRAATTHWFDVDALERDNPTIQRVKDRRYVVDRGIATTTGVSASVPVSLAIVEAIAGEAVARGLARRLGARGWSAQHDSAAFHLGWSPVRVGLGNWVAFWRHERIGVPVSAGVDEIALAFSADAWSRTYRSQALAVSETPGSLLTLRGLELIPDAYRGPDGAGPDFDYELAAVQTTRPVEALDQSLAAIRARYGEPTSALVALQLEYPEGEERTR